MGNSLFPFEPSGVLGWLIGLVGIVLFGVLLMTWVDRKPVDTEDNPEANAGALEHGQARLNALGDEIKRLRILESQQLEKQAITAELEDAVRQLVALTWEEEELDSQLELRLKDLQELNQAQERYALAYRDQLWKNAKGRELESLQTKHGETYRSVKFLEVSNSGLRIRHATGTGVVQVHLLPDELRRELQLDLLQSQRLLREQSAKEWELAKKAREERATQREERPWEQPRRASAPSTERIQLVALLEENRVLVDRLRSLSSEISHASTRANGFGRARSVPGSLETWGERHQRLLDLQDKLQSRLGRTRTRIHAIDPTVRFWPN